MARRFADGFAERTRGAAPRVEACEVEEVYYRPGRHCGVLYRLRLGARDAPAREEWLYARVLPRELLHERYEKAFGAVVAAGASALVRTALDPVSLWDDPGMIVWTFPNDPKLPGLREVADPARVRRQLAAERKRLGLSPGLRLDRPGRGEPPVFERVKYMPTKRCVLRYRVAPERWNRRGTPSFVFFAKAYPAGGSAAPFRLQRAALARLAAAHAPVEIAEPLLHLPAENAIWFAEWGGRRLVDAAAERGWDEMAECAAAALAAFHRVAIPGAPARPAPVEMLVEAREDAERYAARVSRHFGLVRGLLFPLERDLPRSSGARPQVTLHGAFRAEHVLVRGAHAAFIDLDGMSLGDPLFDVAEFVASLEFLALRSNAAPVDTERTSRRFIECYASSVPWAVDGAALRAYVLASILRKLHGAVKRLARPTLERLESDGVQLAGRWIGTADWAPRVHSSRPRNGGARPRLNGVAT